MMARSTPEVEPRINQVHSFPPIENPGATVLILGSMPGKASLKAGQYYAHPRNAFWAIMGDLIGAYPSLDYASRVASLQSAGIALWDVLACCQREGSLDADIVKASIHPNDFNAFFATHTQITRVFFNGTMAEICFHRHVRPSLVAGPLHFQRLPSTSPAHAAKTYAQKLTAWEIVIPEGNAG